MQQHNTQVPSPFGVGRASVVCTAAVLCAIAGVVVAAESRQEEAVAQARRYFAIADYDQNGWISISEAAKALLASREEFFRYDTNSDGGITWDEFHARYTTIVASQGLFQPPIPAPNRTPALPTPTLVWFERFDADRSGGWDLGELTLALAEVGLAGSLNDTLWRSFDTDGSGAIEAMEIDAVMTYTSSARRAAGTAASNLRDLFGVPQTVTLGPGVVAGPTRLLGPLPLFERLDVDGNGVCSVRDLQALEFPAALPIRPQTLIAALDANGDGFLDRSELRASLGLEAR